ncbi:MAG: HlyC/CorC family transporter [Chromatiales bacterium]|nr:HlyC/CorC family transporter [Chromatiales bacterium]
MHEISTGLLIALLVFLIVLSAGFSGSETALMTLNRYRLRHMAADGHGGARRAARLLERPDRLIGLILLGNNFVNILASSIATVVALRLWGEAGIALAAGVLTFIILIFAEVTPKTLAALHPERVAFPAAYIYVPLLKLMYPLVWLINVMANGLLRMLRVPVEGVNAESLSREELRTVVAESGNLLPKRHQRMLLSVLDLEEATVDEIMIPRGDIVGLDLTDPREEIREELLNSQFTRIPVFEGNVNSIIGFLHARRALGIVSREDWTIDDLRALIRAPYFIPEGTPLSKQLLNFQREKRRVGLVVDEYGDVQGLATLEDILEEIVGEFTTVPTIQQLKDIHPQPDGSYLVEGSASVREINRSLGWKLPTKGPKTLSGLIVEHLETIPEPGTSIRLAGYPMEILQTKDNVVKMARILPRVERSDSS